MRTVHSLWVVLVAPALAGCLTEGTKVGLAPPDLAIEGILAGDHVQTVGEPFLWQGATLHGKEYNAFDVQRSKCLSLNCPVVRLPCQPDNCERRTFEVRTPTSYWSDHEGALEVSIRWHWNDTHARIFVLSIEDPAGDILAQARVDEVIGMMGLVTLVEKPKPGMYTAVVQAEFGTSDFEGVIQIDGHPVRPGSQELLPNLITVPPTDLQITTPPEGTVNYFPIIPNRPLAPALAMRGIRGCNLDEIAAAGAQRCLRFSNGVANVGDGPLEVRLAAGQGATYVVGGHFVQRIHRADGSFREESGGPAEFHPMHAHWHNAASNQFSVYRYDETKGTRGEAVNHGRKAGICFGDIGLAGLGLPDTAFGAHHGYECFAPIADGDWMMSLDPNWFDLYPWQLSDQYVDLANVPDGTYTLCSVTNQLRTLVESDYDDNEACTPFRLTGDKVDVLAPLPYHGHHE